MSRINKTHSNRSPLSRFFSGLVIGAVSATTLMLGACDSAPESTASAQPTKPAATAPATQRAEPPRLAAIPAVTHALESAPALRAAATSAPAMPLDPERAAPVASPRETTPEKAPAKRARKNPASAHTAKKRVRKHSGDHKVSIVDSAITTTVKDRMPDARVEAFNNQVGRVWAWTRVRNPGDATDIEMVWRYEGKIMARVPLEIGHSWGWRTWSNKRIDPQHIGEWRVEVLDDEGRLLDEMSFTITGDERETALEDDAD